MTYPGGKGGAGVYQAIINQMPPHDFYIEAFLGAGSVMRMKRPASVNIGIDLDPHAIAGFDAARSSPAPTLLQADAVAFLEERTGWTGRELVYCDPPYLFSTRRSTSARYAHELGDEVGHRRLLDVLKRLPCMVMLSGYPSALYLAELSDWRVVDRQHRHFRR